MKYPIRLIEFRDMKAAIVFNPEFKTIDSTIDSLPSDIIGFDGFFQLCKFGLRTRRKALVACYLNPACIPTVIIGDDVFELGDGTSFLVQVRQCIPIHRVAAISYGGTIFKLRYWWTSGRVWLDDGDIFSYMSRSLCNLEDRNRFIKTWLAKRCPTPATTR